MRKYLISFLCLMVLAASAAPSASAQTRSRFGRKARTATIVGAGALAGALIAGKKGAAIGAGSGALYAFNRRAAPRNFSSRHRRLGTALRGTALGARLGGGLRGKRGRSGEGGV